MSAREQPLSRPTRGAWIETHSFRSGHKAALSRPTRGAWIETLPPLFTAKCKAGRAPHGARGLKRCICICPSSWARSRPTRGAWIETWPPKAGRVRWWSRPTRGAWIETQSLIKEALYIPSRPTRGAWIETSSPKIRRLPPAVAPHTGRVD